MWANLVGDISAGFPSPAEGYEDDALDLHAFLVRNPAATFFYRVEGDDLIAEHVRDGSILVVDRSVRPRPGRLVVVELDGSFSIVRHPPSSECILCGVVVGCVVRF